MRLIDADVLRERMYHDAFEMDSDMQKWDGGCWIRYKMFENAIDDAPTVEPQRWIPVTERLPEENGDYLVTGRQGAVNKRKYDDGHWYGNWAVVAWMPLPKPFREGGAE